MYTDKYTGVSCDASLEQFNKPQMVRAFILSNTKELIKPISIYNIILLGNKQIFYEWRNSKNDWSLGCLTKQQIDALRQANAL